VSGHSPDYPIGGWELSLRADEGIYLVPGVIYHNPINVATFPEYMVGLGEPVLDGGTILLATITAIATAHGNIYLKGISSPSIPGCTGPILLNQANNTLFECPLNVINSQLAQAEFSDTCGETFSQQEVTFEDYPLPQRSTFLPGEFVELGETGRTTYHQRDFNDWSHSFYTSDFCFSGSISKVRYECVVDHGNRSLAVLELEVKLSFWGVNGSRMVVDLPVSRPKECILYNWECFEDLAEGDELLILGEYNGGRYSAYYDGALRRRDGNFETPRGERAFSEDAGVSALREYGEARSWVSQVEAADLASIVRVSRLPETSNEQIVTCEVLENLLGSPATLSIDVLLDRATFPTGLMDFRIPPALEIGQEYLVFLQATDLDRYQLLLGSQSCFAVKDNGLWGRHGDYRGRLEAIRAISMVQSN
jgi:hypothetical protein